MARYPLGEIRRLVRTARSAEAGWPRLRALCGRHWPSPLWERLAGVDPAADVAAAADWLAAQLAAPGAPAPPRGVYLGLDTLNMAGGQGANVELGATADRDATAPTIDWVYALEWYGEPHLIAGLLAMHRVYSRRRWAALFDTADYVLFLGYSGLVLAEAASTVAWPAEALLVWGFHDGDLFVLGRAGPRGLVRLAADA